MAYRVCIVSAEQLDLDQPALGPLHRWLDSQSYLEESSNEELFYYCNGSRHEGSLRKSTGVAWLFRLKDKINNTHYFVIATSFEDAKEMLFGQPSASLVITCKLVKTGI